MFALMLTLEMSGYQLRTYSLNPAVVCTTLDNSVPLTQEGFTLLAKASHIL